MLTIKHVWPRGFETIYPALQVRASMPNMPTGPFDEIPFVAFDKPNGDVWQITQGVVYVMNETGKTIQTYHLSSLDAGESPPASSFTVTAIGDKIYHG